MFGESLSERKQNLNFSEFSFLDIPFQVLREKELKSLAVLEKISIAMFPCEIRGKNFFVQLQKTEGFCLKEKKIKDEFLDIQILDENEIPVIGGNITFQFTDDSENTVKLAIAKKKRILEDKNPLYSGIGREVYKQMMKYIQEKADFLNTSITALVRKMPYGISDESWDHTFVAMLTEAGYRETFDDENIAWKKTYEAKK